MQKQKPLKKENGNDRTKKYNNVNKRNALIKFTMD